MNSKTNDEDFKLIREYQTCNPKPFNRLIEKYYKYVFRLLVFKGVLYETAEDYCQDIWMDFTRTLKVVQLRRSFNSFLNRAVTNRTIDYIRKTNRQRAIFMKLPTEKEEIGIKLLDILSTAEEDILQTIINKDMSNYLRQCINKIKNDQEKLTLCLWLDGCSHKEIAKLMRAPIGTVSAWLHRGKQLIQKCMLKILVE